MVLAVMKSEPSPRGLVHDILEAVDGPEAGHYHLTAGVWSLRVPLSKVGRGSPRPWPSVGEASVADGDHWDVWCFGGCNR